MNNKYEQIAGAKKKIHLLYSSTKPKFRDAEKMASLIDAHEKNLNEEYTKLKKSNANFFNEHNYDWFLESTLFSDPWERHLQLNTIKMLSQTRHDHEHFERLGDIVIITVHSESILAECRLCDEIKCVIISTAFKRLIANYLWYLAEVYDYGKENNIKDDFTCYQTLSTLASSTQIKQKTAAFLGTLFKIANFDVSQSFTPSLSNIISKLGSDKNYQSIMKIPESVEMYIIAHEVAHLVDDSFSEERSINLEIATDISACSLYLLHSLEEKNTDILSLTLGPVIFFELSILFMIVRLILYLKDESKRKFFNKSDLSELVKRRDLYVLHVGRMYGLESLIFAYKVAATKFGFQFDYIKSIISSQYESEHTAQTGHS